MASRKKTSHAPLALRLTQSSDYAHDIFQLNVPSMTGKISLDITTFDFERTLTLACSGPFRERTHGTDMKFKELDLVAALRSGLLELVEHDSLHHHISPPSAISTYRHMSVPHTA